MVLGTLSAARSARRFFDTILRAQDQAALLTFNDRLQRVVPFTDDFAVVRICEYRALRQVQENCGEPRRTGRCT